MVGSTGEEIEMALSQSGVRALPKVELHCHVEGTMRPSTVIDLARAAGIDLPVDDPTEIFDYANLTEFLDVFWLVRLDPDPPSGHSAPLPCEDGGGERSTS